MLVVVFPHNDASQTEMKCVRIKAGNMAKLSPSPSFFSLFLVELKIP